MVGVKRKVLLNALKIQTKEVVDENEKVKAKSKSPKI